MEIRLKYGGNISGNPPGGYCFTVPETGYKISKEHTWDGLFAKVERHYYDNNIPLPDNWKEKVESQMCETLPAGYCHYTDGTPFAGTTPKLNAESIMQGVGSLATMVLERLKGNDVFVSQDEANARAEICSRCHFNQGLGVCMGCGAMKAVTDLASTVRGGRSTKLDGRLNNCSVCGCRNDTIVHIQRKVLLSNEKSETTEARPSWCWVKNEDLIQAKSQLTI